MIEFQVGLGNVGPSGGRCGRGSSLAILHICINHNSIRFHWAAVALANRNRYDWLHAIDIDE